MPYKQTKEGIAQGHAKGKVPSIPDFTTISRRINRLNIKIKEDNKIDEFQDDYIVIVIDSTGKGYKQRPMDDREMRCKKERIFKNTYSNI